MMFDPESTRTTFEQPEKRVLMATVLMAVTDSAIRPGRRDPSMLAMDAHSFLWGERLEYFLHYLDIEPEWFRRTLTRVMEDKRPGTHNHFTEEQRRSFRHNRRVWAKSYSNQTEYQLEEE